uniref:Uncharacterized protein n=1 Tax=Anopheles atroparvus TaxID=41427 RepID=A0A182JAB8_ANOAO
LAVDVHRSLALDQREGDGRVGELQIHAALSRLAHLQHGNRNAERVADGHRFHLHHVVFLGGRLVTEDALFDDELSLEAKTLLPQYGHCWVKSLEVLHDGCRSLSDAVHVDIALLFTGCFMEMSGQEEPPDCVSERTEALKKLCMSQMSDRAFAVYTEFFSQTQNMCFFLQNQNWHIETERTINRLSSYSRAAGEQLELVNGMQGAILREQHKQFDLQIRLMRIGRNLSDSLHGSQLTIEQLTQHLKLSTEQHSLVLEELFREFHQLHRWIVGRYTFVDGLIFYIGYVFLILLLTSLKRTNDARGILMAIVLMELQLQQKLPDGLLSNSLDLAAIELEQQVLAFLCLLHIDQPLAGLQQHLHDDEPGLIVCLQPGFLGRIVQFHRDSDATPNEQQPVDVDNVLNFLFVRMTENLQHLPIQTEIQPYSFRPALLI